MPNTTDTPASPPARSPRRRWTIRLLAVGACWLVGSCTLEALGMKPVSRSVEAAPPYEMRFSTYDAFGHRATRRDVYFGRGRRATLVAEHVGDYYPYGEDASRLLYERCHDGPGPTCGAFLFEGRTGRSRRVSDRYPLRHWGLETPWSPDGRSAAFLEQFGGTVVDLETGESVELGEPLRLKGPERQLTGASWTEDGSLLVRMVEYADGPPYVRGRVSTYRVDPRTGGIRPR
jgi:hypothetical protein